MLSKQTIQIGFSVSLNSKSSIIVMLTNLSLLKFELINVSGTITTQKLLLKQFSIANL